MFMEGGIIFHPFYEILFLFQLGSNWSLRRAVLGTRDNPPPPPETTLTSVFI